MERAEALHSVRLRLCDEGKGRRPEMTFDRSPSRPRILVVEDSYLTAAAVCDMVTKCGFDVAGTVGRVETGLEFVRQHPLDGAVIDIDLPGTASFPICKQLKKRDIPFLFLTG